MLNIMFTYLHNRLKCEEFEIFKAKKKKEFKEFEKEILLFRILEHILETNF